MSSNALRPALFAPFMLWADLGLRTAEMLVASGQVIGTRVGRISRAGANPSARDIKEFTLMGSEKVKAATQSATAIATRVQSANYQLIARGWQQWLANLGAMSSLASSRTFSEALSRQSRLLHSLARSGPTHSRLSSDTARLFSAALAPVHGAATANARRLARTRVASSKR
jgi:hypothetical protein